MSEYWCLSDDLGTSTSAAAPASRVAIE